MSSEHGVNRERENILGAQLLMWMPLLPWPSRMKVYGMAINVPSLFTEPSWPHPPGPHLSRNYLGSLSRHPAI